MLQKPNTVFVGKKTYAGTTAAGLPVEVNALTVGDIVAINPATGGVVATADIVAAATFNEIQLGVVKSVGATNADAVIVKTQTINRAKINSLTANGTCAYVAKTEAVVDLDWTGVTVVAGKRYVIRAIYRDIYEHPGQFTHTYEVIAVTGETIDTLVDKFIAKINGHTGRRVTASKPGGDIVRMTALPVDGPEAGIATKEAITPYSQVQMKVVAYFTDNSSISNNQYQAIAGLTIANTESKPGRGNKFVVRDREQAALGYKGITYRTEWPIIKPELSVDLSATYDTLVVEFEKGYQSPDNQYNKSTAIAAELYIVAGQGAEALRDGIALWSGK